MIALGLLLIALAFWFWRRSKVVEYQLFLMTSSSEEQAVSSANLDLIQLLRHQIEHAMVSQRALPR